MNQMTVVEVTEFLKRQKETTTFTFNMVNPDNFMMVIELKNNSDAYEFIEKNTESTFELVGANELI
ncbi:hypothetical protein [Carnobacterium divergens]|uniref:Uncharacterized protein n=1 Tax=Carnobacterium divergens DSM 20623 TaxID=1449336 RepID=A0A0R2HZ37_CARDV|nr:hypothetical protein [Carnobacterium divergens]KRN58049.1 hypothetical protein IV74_GL001308 [Carnobacterium divergens DSM 20623]MDO0874677.1 hypothetical protein [Carnobacterium divergens]SUX22857.1 Uncharacterised protein [Carnobacterium divergens]